MDANWGDVNKFHDSPRLLDRSLQDITCRVDDVGDLAVDGVCLCQLGRERLVVARHVEIHD